MTTEEELRDMLDEWLSEDEHVDGAWQPFEPSDFEIRDERQLSGMLAKRRRLTAEIERVQLVAQQQIDEMIAWRDDLTGGAARQLADIERALENYMRAFGADSGRRLLPMPSGTLKLVKPGQPKVEVVDEGEFVAWATADDERDSMLNRSVSVEKNSVKKLCALGKKIDDESTADLDVFSVVDAAGEIVPGLRMTKPALDRFSVV